MTKSPVVRSLILNSLTVLLGLLAMVGIFYGAAVLSIDKPAQRLAEAFDNGTLSNDVARELAPLPGLIVFESDYEGACHSYANMLSPSEDLFGRGARNITSRHSTCNALMVTLQGEIGERYMSYFRYWQGSSAFSRIGLTVLTVFWWQVLLTVLIVGLLVAIVLKLWTYSRAFAVGAAIAFFLMIDFPWQGMAPLHGLSSSFGLAFALVTLIAFERNWVAKWGIATLGGVTYAMMAHTLIPMAFAMLTALMAMTPVLRRTSSARDFGVGIAVGVLWLFGYVLATGARALWVATLGPGPQQVTAEWTGTGGGFLVSSWVDPFSQTLGLLMKTWFEAGFMQIGLMAFFLVLGWSLARGGARNFTTRRALIALSPATLGVAWLIVWANHSNHTYVHAVLGLLLLVVLFASEVARRYGTYGMDTGRKDDAGDPSPSPFRRAEVVK